jgi:hypothetical protein
LSLLRTLFAATIGVGLIAAPALAERPRGQTPVQPRDQSRDQDRAFQAARDGRSLPLPNIKQRVMPFMEGADYLSSELHGDTTRMKFMRGGRVIWVDVDGATGRIVRRSQP